MTRAEAFGVAPNKGHADVPVLASPSVSKGEGNKPQIAASDARRLSVRPEPLASP